MEIQTEFLQHSITIEYLPYGSDIPYRIIVGNNPVGWIDPLGLIWVTVGNDYHGWKNSFRWYLNRWTVQAGKGLGLTMPLSDPQELVGLTKDVIQEWGRDPDNSCRDKEYPIGTRRRVPQEYIEYINPGPREVIIKDPNSNYYYQWTPWVSDRTYKNFPGTRYENLYFWRQGK